MSCEECSMEVDLNNNLCSTCDYKKGFKNYTFQKLNENGYHIGKYDFHQFMERIEKYKDNPLDVNMIVDDMMNFYKNDNEIIKLLIQEVSWVLTNYK